jgi:hypothetical protein
LPVPVIFGHFALAAIGLVLWIAYVATDTTGIGWTAFVLLLVVALLGFAMFARWVPTYLGTRRGPDAEPSVYAASATGSVTTVQATATAARTAESHFPVPIVLGHGALAATTLIVVLIALVTG